MAGYVGNVPVPQSVREDQSFTATAGQTTFNTLGYTDGNRIKVTLNGVLLEGGGVDYTATNGSDVVLTVAAVVDDIVRFETFNEVQLVNSVTTNPTFKTSATLLNETEEDIEGGRESTLIFQGEQSGGELTTLAEIEASHDGTADDEKGDLIFRTNDGNDGTSPTERLRINSGGDMLFSSEDPSLTLANTTHEDSDGGRESTIVFQGEQSGGEISTLAHIEAAHDGTADDEKGELIFRTNDGSDGASPTEALRIDSAQNVGISTATPLSGLHISDGTNAGSPQNANRAATLMIDAGATASADLQFMVRNGYNSHIFFGDAADPNIGMLYYDHTNNDMAFNVNAGEKVRFISEGGITFNGDTAAANALDDYEEGSFTPVLTWDTPSNGSVSYQARTATYIKIGRKVTIHLELRLNIVAQNSASLPLVITGFPYNFHNTGGYGGSLMTIAPSGFTISSGHIPFGYGFYNSDKLILRTMASGAAYGNLATPSNYQSINVSGTYITPT